MRINKDDLFYDSIAENYLIEYRGDFKKEIDNVDYAVGDVISDAIGVIAVRPEDKNRLLKDVPSITYMDYRIMVVLQDTSPSLVDNINSIKVNPYMDLDGSNVTVGIIDTGIDYLNKEFIREDSTSRILKIWDQSIRNQSSENRETYIGTVYTNEQINEAIKAQENNQDPYAIVPSKDERGHGTKVAGIIGARGATSEFQGVANRCDFIVVKLLESSNFKMKLKENLIKDIPVYNTSELAAGLEYLKNEFFKLKNKAMVIYLGLGATEGSHDAGNLISRYFNSLGRIRGLCLVTGVGNEGDAQGHVTGYIKSQNESSVQELKIPREIKRLTITVWIQKPNSASLNIISPSGESSKLIEAKMNKVETQKFVFTETEFTVSYITPDNFTGHNVIRIEFKNIKAGIWRLNLVGKYIINGRYDIWLPPHDILPEDLVFLEPNPYNTIMLPATASNAVTVAYYGNDNVLVSSSGKGFDTNINTNTIEINPHISTLGINILTTSVSGVSTTMSGSSAAGAIIAGSCALLLQWGIIKGNDTTMYSKKIRSYLIYGATRNQLYKFPNRELGYGEFNLLGTFNIIARLYDSTVNSKTPVLSARDSKKSNYDTIEYYVNNLFIRVSKNCLEDFEWRKI